MKTKTIETKPLRRSFVLERGKVNEEDRTVELSFSSESPVMRWFGQEILDHAPESVRLERMRQLGPLLVDHNTRDQVGVIEDIQITNDKTGRAVVRFGKGARADEVYQDVLDGIRGNVSCSYQLHKMVLEETDGDEETYRAVDWEVLEISIVSVPADISVGVGRDLDQDGIKTIIETREKPGDPAPVITLTDQEDRTMKTPEEIAAQAKKDEQKRSNEIVALAEQHGIDLKATREFLTGDKSVEDSQRHIMVEQKRKLTEAQNPNELDLSRSEVETYSLMRGINACITGDWDKAGLELRCSQQIAENLGRDARGFFVPMNVQQRDLTAGGVATGGEMVGTDHLAGNFIDALIAESVLGQLGATYLPGLVGDCEIPAMGAATFYWLTDDEDGTDSTPATRSVALSPKTIAGAVPMSRRFVKQSSPAAEAVVERLLRRGAAAAIDQGLIAGTGANGQPLGLFGTIGVNTETIVTPGQPTWANLVNMKTALATDNALAGKLSYLLNFGVLGFCEQTPKDAGSGLFLSADDKIGGRPAVASNLVAANGLAFGNFEDLYVGLWGTLDVKVDEATKAKSGGLVIRVFQDVDGAVGNPESFCVNA